MLKQNCLPINKSRPIMPFRLSKPSFQSLLVASEVNGLKLSNATAFVATATSGVALLITNRHVVTGRNQETNDVLSTTGATPDTLVISHNSKAGLGEFRNKQEKLYVNGLPRWIEHPTRGPSVDLVALPISDCVDIELYPYRAEYFAHQYIEPSSRISVIGFPFGEKTGPSFAVWATGFVASEPQIDHGGKPMFLIDCRTRQGQSGSPVITYQSNGGTFTHDNGTMVSASTMRLLGIYSGRINRASDIGIVWKAYAIAELIDYACAQL